MSSTAVDLEAVKRLSRDLREAALTLSPNEARYLVDSYYQMQENRKASDNQIRSLVTSNEPHSVIQWLSTQNSTLENQIRRALDRWSDGQLLGRWSKSITGIGPVISAGLLANIDIHETVGKIWRFAGLDPTSVWNKGEKRPWNASLKVLCWKIGESFVKVSNLEDDFYGKIYQNRKQYETERNAKRMYKDQAEAHLKKFNIGKDTEAYKHYIQGFLPPGHIHARAKRYAVKLFLSHYHEVGYEILHGKKPPKPYVIGVMGHIDYIPPHNWPMAM